MKEDQILECLKDDNQEPPQAVMPFDVETFFSFIRGDMSNENMGQILQLTYESRGTKYEKKKMSGSSTGLQKVKSLNQSWFNATNNTIEKLPSKNILGKDYIYKSEDSVFKKSYGKWRYEDYANEGDSVMVHVQELEICFNAYQQTPTPKYFCIKLTGDKQYIGTHITPENGS